MRVDPLIAAAALLAGCTREADDRPANTDPAAAANEVSQDERGSGWDLASSGDGVALVLGPRAEAAIRLVCAAGQNRLLVNVPAFHPVGSEERMSFGSGGEVVALVADTRGDSERGGVSGTGAVPANLAALLSGPVSVSYGAQASGPHQAPPEQLVDAFIVACNGEAATRVGTPAEPAAAASACLTHNGKPVPENRLKAVGTEPFWGAEIRGRCVTYSTPDDQEGTRVWTSFTGSADRGEWNGFFDNQRFVLRTRPEPGCSDGMSDKSYPIAVTLSVRGEQRTGCAERL